jgi:hypothetical protein
MHYGSRLAAGVLRYDEGLDVEAADKFLVTYPLIIGLDVALVPGQAERRIGNLEHKEIELRIRWQSDHINIHYLD